MLKALLQQQQIFIVPGVYDGLSTRLAVDAGFDILYMSGFSVAGATYGQPDIGLLTATEMTEAARRILNVADGRPLIADADAGYGGVMNVARIVRDYEREGVACVQLEDQVHPKRCGHMSRKSVVSREEAVDRIKAAVDARHSADLLVMARTDARATDGLNEALDRADLFRDAGADILFIEAPTSAREVRQIATAFPDTPLVINLVEDGKTPWLDWQTLQGMGFRLGLQPVTALLHATANLSETYHAMIQGYAPATSRQRFTAFNALVGLEDANAFTDALHRPRN